ncbi:MAG: LacI family transcriptional regulator [Balneolaceae bacterium]|nr:MAG: LacI family transcriptional regulator [Balneolaceae bacterium]
MKITMQDIANSTGYSVSTVSRVLSGSGKISEKANKKIISAAQKLKYPVTRMRSTQRNRNTLNVGLFTDFHQGEFYASFFYGFTKAAKSTRVRLSLISLFDPAKSQKEILEYVNELYIDGLILFIPEYTRTDYEELERILPKELPVISNALIENPVFTTITFDGYSGGHTAAQYLINRGYKSFGIIKGPFTKAESRFRYNGFKDLITRVSDTNLTWEYEGNFNYDSGVKAFEDFKKLEQKPGAVFASNDLMCHGFMDAARYQGIKVPEDLAVIGYDDLPMCVHSHPRISSIKTDFEKLGSVTLNAMKDKILNPDRQLGILSLIPVSLSSRESS